MEIIKLEIQVLDERALDDPATAALPAAFEDEEAFPPPEAVLAAPASSKILTES